MNIYARQIKKKILIKTPTNDAPGSKLETLNKRKPNSTRKLQILFINYTLLHFNTCTIIVDDNLKGTASDIFK